MGATPTSEPLHRQDFAVHSYEVDTEGLLTPRALFAFLQEAAGGDAARGGYTMERLAEDGLVWMIQWMRVEVERYPVRGETLAVTTWARRLDRALAWREFDVADASRARVAVGTSRWAVVDVEARRLVRLPEFVRRSPVPDRPPALDRGPSALEPADPAEVERRFEVRRGDLDTVRHVNNTRYVEWALETVPDEVHAGCRPSAFEIAFRREATYGDAIVARTRRLAGDGEVAFAHELRSDAAGHELARARSAWRRLG
ncbi:MAG TPA: acyl-ACP thioesterase domain-containing protein [Vicinamibacteria bacterium]|nr:acyl-ACP thioesterase domain-containing protein [Vicinamibacteria bacterium]